MRASARMFAQKKLWLWLLGALGGSGLAYVLVFGLAAAVLGASFAGCEPDSEPALAVVRADAFGVRAAEHSAGTPAALPAGRHAVRHRLVFSRVDRCAGVRQRRLRRHQLFRVRRPDADRLRPREPVQPGPARRCGNASPSAPTPGRRRR